MNNPTKKQVKKDHVPIMERRTDFLPGGVMQYIAQGDVCQICQKLLDDSECEPNKVEQESWESQVRQICTYYSEFDEGTAGYSLSEEQFQNLFSFISSKIREAEEASFEKGYMNGFNDCKKALLHGDHSHCCLIPGKLSQLKGEKE